MIVGCYCLDLYCDKFDVAKGQAEDELGHRHHDFPDQFTGRSRAECVRKARGKGWAVNIPSNKAYCPMCARSRKRTAQGAIVRNGNDR